MTVYMRPWVITEIQENGWHHQPRLC